MPKLSDNTLFQRAIPLAVQDRISLSDAYPENSDHWVSAREETRQIRALKGRHIDELGEDEQHAGFMALVHAEQWVESLADANPGPKVEEESRRALRLFREVRLRRWGKTQLEAMMENAVSVDVRTLMENSDITGKSEG
jgi:hypothetical protein